MDGGDFCVFDRSVLVSNGILHEKVRHVKSLLRFACRLIPIHSIKTIRKFLLTAAQLAHLEGQLVIAEVNIYGFNAMENVYTKLRNPVTNLARNFVEIAASRQNIPTYGEAHK